MSSKIGSASQTKSEVWENDFHLKGNCNAKTSWFHLKILQNEAKFIKIGQAVLEIFNFIDWNLDNCTRKTTEKPKMLFFLEVLEQLKNNGLCEVRNDICTIQQ